MLIAGWLCPDDQFVQCSLFNHLDVIRDNPVFVQAVPEIIDLLVNLDVAHASHSDVSRREGSTQAEWHAYEILSDRTTDTIWRLLLDAGFVRVGEADGSLFFEGRPNVLKSRYQACKDLAESYDTNAVFEPQR